MFDLSEEKWYHTVFKVFCWLPVTYF